MPIVIIICVALLLFVITHVKKIKAIITTCAVIGFTIWIFNVNTFLAVLLLVGIVAFCIWSTYSDKKFYQSLLAKWSSNPTMDYETLQVENAIAPFIDKIYEADTNSAKRKSELPYGRITYFLNFFERNLDQEEPLYFSPQRSRNNDELREYGTLITTSGIYVSYQLNASENEVSNIALPFSAIIGTKIFSGDKKNPPLLKCFYATGNHNGSGLSQAKTTIPVNILQELFTTIVDSGISKSMYENRVYAYEDIIKQNEEKIWAENTSEGYAKAFEATGIGAALGEHAKMYDAVRNNMNQRQGHGTAAEYANTVIDKLEGKNAVQIGGDNAKDGADRIITSFSGEQTLIQSKYCKTSSDTLKSAFDEHDYPLNMKIEVPRDQYNECVNKLQKKIDNGDYEYKGIHKGERAESYLKKGHITYSESLNIAIAGRIEGIMTDIGGGVICSAGAGSITALLTFAVCKWNGMETKDAALESLKTGAAVIGKSTIIYVATMQLSRKTMVADIFNVFSKTTADNAAKTVANPIFKLSENIAGKISGSAFAKTAVGQKMGLGAVTGRAVISGTVVAVVTFGPDIVRALSGKISFKQLIKNSAVGGAGIAGAAIGQTIIPIPIVGAMIGGAVAGFVAKKALDCFIEDDAIEMFAILKEEFIDVVPSSGLNQEEFDKVVASTLSHPKLSKLLQEMYAYGDSRKYAREHIVCTAVQGVMIKRDMVTEEMYDNGIALLATDNKSEPENIIVSAT